MIDNQPNQSAPRPNQPNDRPASGSENVTFNTQQYINKLRNQRLSARSNQAVARSSQPSTPQPDRPQSDRPQPVESLRPNEVPASTQPEPAPSTTTTTQSTQNQESQSRESSSLPKKPPKMEKSRVAPGLYKPQPERTLLEWTAPSRPFTKKSRQYFTTITVIALLICLILFFAGQFLPIAVVISIVFLVYVLAVIPPENLKHKLTTFGIRVEKNLYYWEELGRFWFENKKGQTLLHLETIRFPGRVTLLLGDTQEDQLREILAEVLLEEEPESTFYEKASGWLKEKIPLEDLG